MKKCASCGHENLDSSAFCAECGARLQSLYNASTDNEEDSHSCFLR